MAVTKMEKVTLISDKLNQELVLQTVQGLQNVEIRDLYKESDNNAWVSDYFGEKPTIVTREAEIHDVLVDIESAIQFIQHHGDNQQKKQLLKRQAMTLEELEKAFDEDSFKKELAEILALQEQWGTIEKKKQGLLAEEDWLTGWQYLDVNPNGFQSKVTSCVLGTIASVNADSFKTEVAKLGDVYLEEVFQDEKETLLSFVYLPKDQQAMEDLCNQYNFTKVDYPYPHSPKRMLKEVKDQLAGLHAEEAALSVRIGDKADYIQTLQWAEESLLAMSEREKIKEQFVQSTYLFVLQGWLGVDEKADFLATLYEKVSQEDIFVHFEEPTKVEIQTEVPTKLKNNSLVAPFEMLTEMYSLPKYEEVDPTPWFTPFYIVFFGMMVADIGYGLLMLIATILVERFMVLPRESQRFVKFFKILAFPTIVWGIIYGSFFGAATPFDPILSTSDDVIQILALSVIFGFIQILVGLFVAAKEHIKRQEYLEAISNGFAWQGILVGILIAVVGSMVVDNGTIKMIGTIIAIVSAVSIIVVPVIQSTSKVKGAAKGAYALYGITGYIGDLVSYTRLMALGISGGSIAAAFNMLVAFMPPVARFTVGIVLIIALHALNIFLSLLGAYVHGARLQYVEFFGKFYTGGGRTFTPLKTAEKYVNIESKKQKR